MDKKKAGKIAFITLIIGFALMILAITVSFVGLGHRLSEYLFWLSIAFIITSLFVPYAFLERRYSDQLIEEVRNLRASGKSESKINEHLSKKGYTKDQIKEILALSNFYGSTTITPTGHFAMVSHKGYVGQSKPGFIGSTIALVLIALAFLPALFYGVLSPVLYLELIGGLVIVLIFIPLLYRRQLRKSSK